MKKTLSFIGCGNMAGAIINGAEGYDICMFDTDAAKYERFEGRGFKAAENIAEAVANGDYIFLCVKPQVADSVLPLIAGCDLGGKVVVSIMAGITLGRLSTALGADTAIVRTMPNTPLMLGKGVTGICRNGKVSDKKFSDICRLFSEMGEIMVVTEDKITAVTCASGSAPAYVYLFIKAIADEAAKMGLDQKNMNEIIARMVIGSCHMVLESGQTPDELIRMVCSPNGTTERAMKVFEEKGFCDIISEAMQACGKRAEELAQ